MAFSRIDVLEANIEFFSKPDAQYSSIGGIERQDFTCMYRLDGTASCPIRYGIGVMIPDALYDPEFESKTVEAVVERYPAVAALFDDECFDINRSNRTYGETFLGDLQSIHDRNAENKRPMEHFVAELQAMLDHEKDGTSNYA